jgi:polysaccharide biosynthesis/export protein
MNIALLFLLPALLGAQSARVAPMPEPIGNNLPAQKIGANDLLAISVYDSAEFTRTVRVGADGSIRLPMLKNPIPVEGMMPQDVEIVIAVALQEAQLIVDPLVTVTVAQYHSRPISIIGAVKKPVTFQAVGPTTLLEALSQAEGLTQDAGQEILVSRAQPGPDGTASTFVRRIPVRALIDAADPEMNLKLSGGEEIRVPEAGKIFVVGNVKRPGAFPVRDSAETTVLKALALSEGLLPFAGRQAYIYRREGGVDGKRSEVPIELKKIMDRKSPDVTLLTNDVLYIPDRQGRRIGFAALEKVLLIGGGMTSALVYATVR